MVQVVTQPTGKPATCKSCGAGLTYMPQDVRRDYTSDYTGDRDYYNAITCPCCGSEVRVN